MKVEGKQKNIRGSINRLNVGESLPILFSEMKPSGVRTTANIVKTDEEKYYTVNVDREKKISTVTRTK